MRLSTGLDAAGIGAVREQVACYTGGLQAKADELCRRLARIGVDAAVAGIGRDESGELRSSIRLERRGGREYAVLADCGHAVYVEFGTGVVGASRSYPGERPAWAGTPGSRSTRVNADGSWSYYDEKQERWRVTSGQAPQGFMARSAAEVRQAVRTVAKEVFG